MEFSDSRLNFFIFRCCINYLKKRTIKTTIPDINNSTTKDEIKDVKTLNNTKQIRAEAEVAAQSGKHFILYTGKERHISKTVLKQYEVRRLDWLGPQ